MLAFSTRRYHESDVADVRAPTPKSYGRSADGHKQHSFRRTTHNLISFVPLSLPSFDSQAPSFRTRSTPHVSPTSSVSVGDHGEGTRVDPDANYSFPPLRAIEDRQSFDTQALGLWTGQIIAAGAICDQLSRERCIYISDNDPGDGMEACAPSADGSGTHRPQFRTVWEVTAFGS
ncbi:hypothetical protein NM688_g587 [Phlebia brevispora]|uniref:Uncharacterized protein n=1 Tax=Phlebia brevispora TaxID=194682 RepID=A0ACC1TE27_9APHY|nr:hypothetical protein NM688_g587 [Phlebia brevispora]